MAVRDSKHYHKQVVLCRCPLLSSPILPPTILTLPSPPDIHLTTTACELVSHFVKSASTHCLQRLDKSLTLSKAAVKEHAAHLFTLTPRTLTQLHTCGVVHEPMCSLGGYQYNQLFTKPVRISATASQRCPLIWLMSSHTCTTRV